MHIQTKNHTLKSIIGLLLLPLLLLLSSVSPAQAAVTVTYYHTDALGSVVAASDESDSLLWTESYRPYGERQENFVSTDEHALFFTGKPHDDDTGLSYFGARYYNPSIGRFMGVDPAGFQDSNIHSFNKYAYANNNPYKYVDPDGELPILLLAFVAYDFYSNYQETGNIGDAAKAAALGIINPFKKIKTTVNIAKKFKVTKSAGKADQSKLKRIHSDETLNSGSNKFDLESQRTRSTQDITDSLKPGASEPLKVKADGRIFDGNTRIKVLEERGVDINSLPRTTID